MAMFVLVVDTSIMNVSISAVVKDLGTSVSGVQSAISLEALVSAAFILIGSKVGDLIGRKRAYVLGLGGYAVGATAMTLAQGLTRRDRLLGDRRGHRRVAAAACDAVADPRQLRGQRAEEGLRHGRRGGGGRCRGGTTARWVHHHLPLVAGRLRARGRHDRGRAVRDQARQGRPLHRAAAGRHRRIDPVRRRHGRSGPRDPGVAGGRRPRRRADARRRGGTRRTRRTGCGDASAREGDPARPGPVRAPSCSGTA